jgi:hypothetical protein
MIENEHERDNHAFVIADRVTAAFLICHDRGKAKCVSPVNLG